MTMVIFVGLLIDLLAFTLILPLFPALLDHYRDAFNSNFVCFNLHFLNLYTKRLLSVRHANAICPIIGICIFI